MTHRKLVAILSGSPPLEIQLQSRFIKFVLNDIDHENRTLRVVTQLFCINPMSICGFNWRDYACNEKMEQLHPNDVYSNWKKSIAQSEYDISNVIQELIGIREGWGECDIMDIDDVNHLIEDLCVN